MCNAPAVCARDLADGRERGEERAQCIGNFRRAIERREMSAGKLDERRVQQLGERLSDRPDRQELIAFAPQDDRGHAAAAKLLGDVRGLARIEIPGSAGSPPPITFQPGATKCTQ